MVHASLYFLDYTQTLYAREVLRRLQNRAVHQGHGHLTCRYGNPLHLELFLFEQRSRRQKSGPVSSLGLPLPPPLPAKRNVASEAASRQKKVVTTLWSTLHLWGGGWGSTDWLE